MSGGTCKAILLVEADLPEAIATKTALEPRGYDVQLAQSVEAARISLTTNQAVDLLLMDPHLATAQASGNAMDRILDGRDIPVIFLSGRAENDTIAETLALPSYGYVARESGTIFLDASIRTALRLHSARRVSAFYATDGKADFSFAREKERLRSTLIDTYAGTWEWDVGTDDLTLDDKSMAILGYAPGETRPDSLGKWLEIKHPDDKDASRELMAQYLRGETEYYSFESRMRHRNGSWVWIIARGKVIARDENGKPLRVFGTHIDITKRKLAEEALQESAYMLNRAEKIAKIGNWKLMLDTRTMVFSKGMGIIFGMEGGTISRWDARGIGLPEYGEMLDRALAELLANDSPYDAVFKIRRPEDGQTVDIHSIADYDRKANILYGVVQDITEQKRADDRIKSLLAEKDLMLKEVHHRIKNNMGTMISLLSLQAHSISDETASAALEDAENRMRSMGVLYDKLYQSTNLMEMSARDYLPSLIEEIMAVFPNSGKIRVVTDIEDFKLSVKQLSALGIIVNEVLTNSLKYAFARKEKGSISLSASRKGRAVTIIIADDGIGIPAGIDPEHTTEFGLMLIASLTKQLDGKLRIERKDGTRFTLDFPAR